MYTKPINFLRLFVVIFTLVAIGGHALLPKKELVLHPSVDSVFELFTDEGAGGKSSAKWLDEKSYSWQCILRESETYPVCGFSTIFSPRPYKAMDLSSYDALKIQLHYTGNAEKIRIYLRNSNPAYNPTGDIEEAKFESIVIRTSDLEQGAEIQLSEFSVGDWWKDQYDIPRNLSQPEFDAVIAIGIDQAAPIQYGQHQYQLSSVTMTGEWIKQETLYLYVILSWMLVLAWEVATRLIILYRRARKDSASLEALQAETDKFRELSHTDLLTKIPNRSGFDLHLKGIIERQGNLKGYALLILDIDHFKRVNDQRGHDTGDRILRHFATLVCQSVRNDDFFARWGGEEFVIMLETSDTNTALAVAEKVRLKIHTETMEPQRPLKITVSIGVAMISSNEKFNGAFKRADKALYQAKRDGRNCIVLADN